MTTYNTGNPVGSVDVRDLYDNAQNLDDFSNGPLDAYADRLGVMRQSLQGIRNASQYVDLGPYAAGLVFTSRNQVFSYDAGSGAEFYAPGPAITLPYTTTGVGAGEIANFRSVGDAVLRSDLAADTGAGRVGFDPVLSYPANTVGSAVRLATLATYGVVTPHMYGAIVDGSSHPLSERYATLAEAQAVYPHATALTNEIDWCASQAALNSGSSKVHFLAGHYKISGTLLASGDTTVTGEGSGVVALDAGGSTGTFTSSVLLKSGSPPAALPALASNVAALSNTLVFSAPHGLSVNSIGMIYNPTDFSFSNFRAEYRAGEYFTVSEVVDANTVKLTAPVYSPYLAANVLMYSCDGYAKGSVSGLSIIAPGAGDNGIISALRVFNCTSFSVHDVSAIGSDNATVSISQCYKGRVFDITANQFGQNPGFGTQYGLVYGNTQELDISGTFYGYRHAIAGGGGATFAVPSRAVVAHDFFAANYAPATPAINWHGNCEHCEYRDGVVYGAGVTLAGNKNKASGLTITTSVGFLATAGELLGCDFTLDNISCTTGIDDVARGIINIGGNESPLSSDTKFGGTFKFTNIKITAPNQTRNAVLLRNRGFTAEPINIIVDNLETQMPSASTFAAVSISTVSGNAPTYVQATNIQSLTPSATRPLSLGASDAGCLVRQGALSGTVTVNTTTGVNNVSSAVTFPRQFAKTPAVNTTSASRTTGSDRLCAYSGSPTSTGFSALLGRVDDATSFSAALAVSLHWSASLNEW